MYVRGPGEVRWGSRRRALGVKEKCIDFFVSVEYNILIWALKGPTNICLALIRIKIEIFSFEKRHIFSIL